MFEVDFKTAASLRDESCLIVAYSRSFYQLKHAFEERPFAFLCSSDVASDGELLSPSQKSVTALLQKVRFSSKLKFSEVGGFVTNRNRAGGSAVGNKTLINVASSSK